MLLLLNAALAQLSYDPPPPSPPPPNPLSPPPRSYTWVNATSPSTSVVNATCTGAQCSGDQQSNAEGLLTGGATLFSVDTIASRKDQFYVYDLGNELSLSGIRFIGESSGFLSQQNDNKLTF